MLKWSKLVCEERSLADDPGSWKIGHTLTDCSGSDRMASKPSRLGSDPDPAIDSHPGVSQARRFVNVCAVPRMAVKRASRLLAGR